MQCIMKWFSIILLHPLNNICMLNKTICFYSAVPEYVYLHWAWVWLKCENNHKRRVHNILIKQLKTTHSKTIKKCTTIDVYYKTTLPCLTLNGKGRRHTTVIQQRATIIVVKLNTGFEELSELLFYERLCTLL